jgi:GTP-binding protein
MNPLYCRAEFTTAAYNLKQLPEDSRAEVAFAGRSNAGKSSAINTITRHGKLARTSKTPGRTQEINYFGLGDGLYLADLPGYGYAKVPKKQLEHWRHTLTQYLVSRKPLRCLILVMDIRHPLTDYDWLLINAAQRGGVGLHCLLTKADKLSRSQANAVLMKSRDELAEAGIEATLQTFSSLKKQGIDDAHELLDMYLLNASQPADESGQAAD